MIKHISQGLICFPIFEKHMKWHRTNNIKSVKSNQIANCHTPSFLLPSDIIIIISSYESGDNLLSVPQRNQSNSSEDVALNVDTDKPQNLEFLLNDADFAKFFVMEDFKHYKEAVERK